MSTASASLHPALAALLNAGHADELLASWPNKALAAHGDPARLPRPLQALRQAGPHGLFDGYRGAFAFGRGALTAHPAAGEGHPGRYHAMGLTVHLHEIGTQLPGSAEWLNALETELGVARGSARLAVFASPAGDGLPWHFDGEDVISVQLIGEKDFAVAPVQDLRFPVGDQFGPGMVADEKLYAQCENGFPEPPEDGFETHSFETHPFETHSFKTHSFKTHAFRTIRMRPGSVLFLPRGHWHRTLASSDSLSVSVVLRPPTAAQLLLRAMEQRLLGDAAWRTPLYGSAQQQREWLDGLLQTLPALGHPDAQALLAGRIEMPEDIRDTQRWQAVPGATLEIDASTTPPLLTVSSLDEHQGLPRVRLQRPVGDSLLPLLNWLRTRRAVFSTAELQAQAPQLPAIDVRRLLIGLAEAGALRARPPGAA